MNHCDSMLALDSNPLTQVGRYPQNLGEDDSNICCIITQYFTGNKKTKKKTRSFVIFSPVKSLRSLLRPSDEPEVPEPKPEPMSLGSEDVTMRIFSTKFD